MEKALALLEKHVQWLALGVGVLFLGLMVYWYVIEEPVTVEVQGEKLTPGQLDLKIAENADAKRLKREMSSTQAPTPPEIPPAGEGMRRVVFREVAVPPYAPDANDPTKNPQNAQVAVNYKPVTIPAPTHKETNWLVGRGVANWVTLQPAPTVVPGNPAAPPPVAALVPPPLAESRDIDYASFTFQVSTAEMAKMMEAAGIKGAYDPFGLQNRYQFLGAEVVRQEKTVAGGWAPNEGKVVAVLPPYQQIMKDLPGKTATAGEQFAYMSWAAQHVKLFVQPPFPQIVSGQPWYEPGTTPTARIDAPPPAVQPGVPQPGFTVPPRPGVPFTPPQIPGREGSGVRGLDYVGPDGPVMLTSAPLGRPGFEGPGQGFQGGTPIAPEGFGQPQYGTASAGQIPGETSQDGQGGFNPAEVAAVSAAAGQVSGDVTFFAHDITCEAGKTYRYKLRYWVRNPYWQASRQLKKELTSEFAIESAWSPWTKAVTIPPRVEVFAKSVEKNADPTKPEVARFDVFVTINNQLQPQEVRLSPGDPIAKDGGANKTASWNSGWSLVDIRKNPKTGKYYMLLTDSNGQLVKRDPEKDQVSPELFKLKGPQLPPPGAAPGIEGVPRPAGRPPIGGTPIAPGV